MLNFDVLIPLDIENSHAQVFCLKRWKRQFASQAHLHFEWPPFVDTFANFALDTNLSPIPIFAWCIIGIELGYYNICP